MKSGRDAARRQSSLALAGSAPSAGPVVPGWPRHGGGSALRAGAAADPAPGGAASGSSAPGRLEGDGEGSGVCGISVLLIGVAPRPNPHPSGPFQYFR
jgi:hypothetical protein